MDDRLSPIEAIMWKAGQDPTLRMTVGIVMILDRAPNHDALLERLDAVIKVSPRLQSRPGDSSLTHACPAWVGDDAPAAEHHLRTAALSRPGTQRQLFDLVGLLERVPFDAGRAPWDATLIEGLDGDRAALYLRAHHVVTDGLAGLRLAGRFFDGDEIDLREPRGEVDLRDEGASASGNRSGIASLDLTKALFPFRVTVNAVRDPDTVKVIVRGIQDAVDLATSVSRQVAITGGSLSPLLADHSQTTHFEVMSVPGARAGARALGGSRNDLLVAGAAFGLGLYHDRLGLPCDELRLSTPTSQRRGHDAGGNWFTPARVTVPTTADSPQPYFDIIAARLTQARVEPALRIAAVLMSTFSYLPPQVLIPALHSQVNTVDFVATAIPGLRAGYICGSRIETSYPFGPRLGCPVNLTAFGNRDRLDVGIALDPAAITEPGVFLECLDEAFATLMPSTGAR